MNHKQISNPQFSNWTTTTLSSPFGSKKEAHGVSIKITLKLPDMEYDNDYNSNYTTPVIY